MNANPPCPVCRAATWEVLAEQSFSRNAYGAPAPYLALRLDVLFDTWFPGSDPVRIEWVLCSRCGLIIYRPRPGEKDLDRKYTYLADHESGRAIPPESPGERKRSRDVYRSLARYLPASPASVLDVGGHDGRLMRAFLDARHRASVVDYHRQPLAGVERLGNKMDDLQQEAVFDAMVFSHVLEHVAEPAALLTRARGHLAAGGAVFVEVPMEVWKKAPSPVEPVTHLNYFTPGSTRYLLQQAGFHVARCRMEPYRHPTGRRVLVVRAVGIHVPGRPPEAPAGDTREVRRLLRGSPRASLRRAALLPFPAWRSLLRRLGTWKNTRP